MSFSPIVGLLMLFLQFGQLKTPTPRGPSIGHPWLQLSPKAPQTPSKCGSQAANPALSNTISLE